MRRPAGDDRPFPEQDYLVFPAENMYDRIVMPDRGVTAANGDSLARQNKNNENQSTLKIKGKSVTTKYGQHCSY
jgi:hypothetical protein